MAATLQFFPFGKGLHQENDNRLQDPGTPRAVVNLVRTKNGRLNPRHDYETIANTIPLDTGLELFDLHTLNDRIIGLGDSVAFQEAAKVENAVAKSFSLVERSTFNWEPDRQPYLSCANQLRNVGLLSSVPGGVTFIDSAAGGGLVCNVYQLTSAALTYICIHVFNPATGQTISETIGLSGEERPRVCFCGATFFITAITTATNAIVLRTFSLATSVIATITSPLVAGASIVAYDLSTANEGTTFWLAVARSDTTTALRGLDTTGTVTYTTAGPAVLGTAITIIAHALVGGVQRIHVCIVRNTTLNIDMYSYLPPTTTPYASTTDMFTPNNGESQVGLVVLQNGGSATTSVLALWNEGTSISFGIFVCTTHAVTALSTLRKFSRLNSKPLNRAGKPVFGFTMQEGVGFSTHCLAEYERSVASGVGFTRPAAVEGRLLAQNCNAAHLPAISHDSSTGFSYWLKPTTNGQSVAQPDTTEMIIGGTQRRHSAQLGSVLYITGGVLMGHDGRGMAEAGGFLIRPRIDSTSQGGGGALTLLATYQLLAKYEILDSFGNRLQSAPSDIVEVTLTSSNNQITCVVTGPFSFWNGSNMVQVAETLRGRILYDTYRTLNTANGNVTFHFDAQGNILTAFVSDSIGVVSVLSDVAISATEIIYTQGARGALSGPLEIVTPDSCSTIAASADRILTGGLTRESAFQESRPLLIGEQSQWSDSIGFYRDVRARILAVARLDERRILFTATEIFEADGPGLDDNGLGDIGAPRRLPSDVGLYGGANGWRSLVEMSAGLIFQGQPDQLYLLPRGGVTPVPIGSAVEDQLALYPVITSAVYINEDQAVRFTCNNVSGTESIVLLFDVRFAEWFTEGPYAFGIRASAKAAGRYYLLSSTNVLMRLRTQATPLVFVDNAWRSGVIHPWKPGMFGRLHAVWFYGTVRGNCRIRCIITYDERDTETHDYVEVFNRPAGSQFRFRFEFNQVKCENAQVDFEITSFQNEATAGLDYTYWAIEGEASGVPNEPDPDEMS